MYFHLLLWVNDSEGQRGDTLHVSNRHVITVPSYNSKEDTQPKTPIRVKAHTLVAPSDDTVTLHALSLIHI